MGAVYGKLNDIYHYSFNTNHSPPVVENYTNNHPEHIKMMKDFIEFGSSQEGIYNGIKWSMIKPYNTYWCGYVLYDGELNDNDYRKLENLSHGGLTSGLGFDCAHWYDYSPMETETNYYRPVIQERSTFRNYHYVKEKLFNMIDYIVSDRIDSDDEMCDSGDSDAINN